MSPKIHFSWHGDCQSTTGYAGEWRNSHIIRSDLLKNVTSWAMILKLLKVSSLLYSVRLRQLHTFYECRWSAQFVGRFIGFDVGRVLAQRAEWRTRVNSKLKTLNILDLLIALIPGGVNIMNAKKSHVDIPNVTFKTIYKWIFYFRVVNMLHLSNPIKPDFLSFIFLFGKKTMWTIFVHFKCTRTCTSFSPNSGESIFFFILIRNCD